MKKKLIIAGVGAAAVLALAAGIYVKGSGQKQGGPGGAGGMQQEASYTIVKAAEPTTGTVSVSTQLTGTVEAADVVHVYAKASGDVTAVHVKAGDMVTQGQILCEIDTEQVDTAKNNMDSAEVSYNEAQSNLNRMQILYSGGDISDQEYEQYQNQLKSAKLQYENAKLNYEQQVEYSTVTAPIAGRVESCDVEVYDRISAQSELCVIAGEGDIRIECYVTQRMMKNLSVGDEITVLKNGTSYSGNITEISTMVDESTGLFKIKAEVANTDEIAIGSSVKLSLVTDKAENAMLVPVDAIYYSGGDAYVYLYEDGFAKMAAVEVGLYDSENAEILSGLSADDLVVSTWSSNLYEGANVRLMDEVEAEDAAAESAGSQGAPADAAGQAPAGKQ